MKISNKALGVPELIAIALGGMIGGGIFTVLGISVSMIGLYTPLAFILGGLLAIKEQLIPFLRELFPTLLFGLHSLDGELFLATLVPCRRWLFP